MIGVSVEPVAIAPLQGWKRVVNQLKYKPVSYSVPTGVKVGAAALIAGLVLLLATLLAVGFYGGTAAKAPAPKVAKTVTAPAVAPKGCSDAQTENTTAFATCPSFALNFLAQPNGSFVSNSFNVYTGAPEANNEAQLYTNNTQNLRVENGSLVLEVRNDPQQGFLYTSSRIDTHNKKDFQYGKFSIRAQVPAGVGTWPAIWMLPSQPRYASMSPASDYNRYLNDGEIDILEAVGAEPTRVYGIAHSRAYPSDGPDRSYYSMVRVPDNTTAFHDYGVEWTPTSLTFTLDGKPYFSYNKKAGADYTSWPFDQPYYLIFNLAMGGSWGGQDKAHFPGDGVDKSALPASLKIQSVRYYPYIGK
jgi:beta-glucanase (GH16 family)